MCSPLTPGGTEMGRFKPSQVPADLESGTQYVTLYHAGSRAATASRPRTSTASASRSTVVTPGPEQRLATEPQHASAGGARPERHRSRRSDTRDAVGGSSEALPVEPQDVGNLVVLALLGVWFVTLAPTVFKGPAGYIEVSGHSMDGTYETGDLILTHKQDTLRRRATSSRSRSAYGDGMGQVIHRIVGGNGTTGYTTQGDNNPDPDPWHPTDADVVGKAWHRFEGKAWIIHLPQRPLVRRRGRRCPHPGHARARCHPAPQAELVEGEAAPCSSLPCRRRRRPEPAHSSGAASARLHARRSTGDLAQSRAERAWRRARRIRRRVCDQAGGSPVKDQADPRGLAAVVGVLWSRRAGPPPRFSGAAARLLGPLQTWRLENAAPVLPGIIPACPPSPLPVGTPRSLATDDATSQAPTRCRKALARRDDTGVRGHPGRPGRGRRRRTSATIEPATDPLTAPSDSSASSDTSGPARTRPTARPRRRRTSRPAVTSASTTRWSTARQETTPSSPEPGGRCWSVSGGTTCSTVGTATTASSGVPAGTS